MNFSSCSLVIGSTRLEEFDIVVEIWAAGSKGTSKLVLNTDAIFHTWHQLFQLLRVVQENGLGESPSWYSSSPIGMMKVNKGEELWFVYSSVAELVIHMRVGLSFSGKLLAGDLQGKYPWSIGHPPMLKSDTWNRRIVILKIISESNHRESTSKVILDFYLYMWWVSK